MGTEQINILMHNTLYVPGHFHGTVVAGTTLAFMGITYLVVPLLFRREIIMKKVAKWQPYAFGIGVAGISVFMMGAGTLGVSRRHWDINFTDAALSFDYPATAFAMMGLNGVFALLAGLGGLMFVAVVVGSILFGQRRDEQMVKSNPIVADGNAIGSYGSEGTVKLPGTIILVAVFFGAFVLYYFINWKFLSEVWPLS
jgi:cytochrome c oxidase subunit 1